MYSCNSCQQKNETAPNINYKKVENARYHFSFSIPENWNALDISDNGDGYFISTPDSGAKIKVYGEMIVNGDKQFLSANQNMHEFTFNDNYVGKLYNVDSTEVLISRSDSLIRVNAYLNPANTSEPELEEQFFKMAKSLKIN